MVRFSRCGRTRSIVWSVLGAVPITAALLGAGCGTRAAGDANGGAPPPAVVEREGDGGAIHVEHPERFALVAATKYDAAPTLTVTGVVTPDVSRTIPVVSLASGRVVELRTRLGDQVTKGDLLMRIQSPDVSSALSDYKKAQSDDVFAQADLDRAHDLYEHKAIAKKDLDAAENTRQKARVDLENATQHLRVLGVDPHQTQTSAIVDVVAPASGVIVEQNVTTSAGVKTLDNSPNLLTIADLSRVWIVCDVYETDLATVHLGDEAQIHLTAYPNEVLKGRISNIGAVLDPNLRTAKVRIEVANPGMLRVGLFVTATFRGQHAEELAVVPTTAILHLHDRAWVYVREPSGEFRRREIVSGPALADNMQAIRSGLRPGERVVANALVFQDTVEQ